MDSGYDGERRQELSFRSADEAYPGSPPRLRRETGGLDVHAGPDAEGEEGADSPYHGHPADDVAGMRLILYVRNREERSDLLYEVRVYEPRDGSSTEGSSDGELPTHMDEDELGPLASPKHRPFKYPRPTDETSTCTGRIVESPAGGGGFHDGGIPSLLGGSTDYQGRPYWDTGGRRFPPPTKRGPPRGGFR